MAYHLRRADREIQDAAVMESIIKAGKFAVCALCADNEPYVVTLSYGYDCASGQLYFHCADEGVKQEIVKKNQKVCLTIIDDMGYMEAECSHAYRTVVIRGEMEPIDDEKERLSAVKTLISHFEKDPAHMMRKVDSNSPEWVRTRMLRLTIREMSEKEQKKPRE